MKKILITGANSYIGQSFEEYMQQYKDAYQVDTLDMIGDAWREKELSGYDVIFHVAGIVHQKETDHTDQQHGGGQRITEQRIPMTFLFIRLTIRQPIQHDGNTQR
jgi:dTDP-D-glucose 4,6-dehydratase